MVEHRVGVLDPVFQALTHVGSFGLVWLAIALAVAFTVQRGRALPLRVAIAVLLAELSSGELKLLIGRHRPELVEDEPGTLVNLPGTGSFPSGHSTVSFACATVLAVALPRLALQFYVLAGLIGFSRVYVGVHYPADVVAGAVLGVLVGLLVAFGDRLLRRLAGRGATAPPTPRADPPRSPRTPPPG